MPYNQENIDPTDPAYSDAILAEQKQKMAAESARLGRPLRTDEKLKIIVDVRQKHGFGIETLPLYKVLTDQTFDPGVPGYTGYTLPGALDTPEQRAAIEQSNQAKLNQDLRRDVVQTITAPLQGFWQWLPWLAAGGVVLWMLSQNRKNR